MTEIRKICSYYENETLDLLNNLTPVNIEKYHSARNNYVKCLNKIQNLF